uniref:G-patch domain-containing protein n=1 Tax=Plectus sambesii TaxID=2011161 RepID=A0A914WJ82_9BILA
MSILAAPRKKQRIGIDPQNKNWKNDTEKFGQKMMEKMGWSEGKGLGAKEQGVTDAIKLKANWDAKGLGCDHKYDETWIAHHDDFADLLAQLNANKETTTGDGTEKDKRKKTEKDKQKSAEEDDSEVPEAASDKSLEQKSRKSKARIHYHKFTRGKDLARYSSEDKSSVLGGKNHKRKAEQLELAPSFSETDSGEKVESQVQTTTSTLSVSDYFAMKMKKLKKSIPEPALDES